MSLVRFRLWAFFYFSDTLWKKPPPKGRPHLFCKHFILSLIHIFSESETDAKSDTDEEKNLQLLPEGKKAEMEASEFHSQESPVRDSTETFVPADGVFVALGTAGSAEMARQIDVYKRQKLDRSAIFSRK